MDAKNVEFTKFMGTEVQYFVPIYQRKYSWNSANCLKLLDDIVKVAQDNPRPCHFLGSIIYLAKTDYQHASAAKQYMVIDGQQRLATMSILLIALADYTQAYIKDTARLRVAETSFERLSDRYLVNRFEEGDMYYKIRLNDEDFDTYKQLFKTREKPRGQQSTLIFDNYSALLRKMLAYGLPPQTIFEGIKKLVLVDICLVPGDNAQLVFETVNSTGLPLSTADKIRNYILMSLSPTEQTNIYNEYWHPMELTLGLNKNFSDTFDDFFRYYMSVVTGKQIPNDYYEIFKDYYYTRRIIGTVALVREICDYAGVYKKWITATERGDEIDRKLAVIRSTGQLKITPVIMLLLSEINKGHLSHRDAYKILCIIETYFMRRSICALPANTAGPVCLSMLRSIKGPDYISTFLNNLEHLTYGQRLPDNDEMRAILRVAPIYSQNASRTKSLLDILENFNRKEHLSTSEYTIEHIMPQKLSEEWLDDLGETAEDIHKKYLHTLGNLTLSGYNSEYRNFPFSVKRDMDNGYRHSPVRLNRSLCYLEKWGENEILERADKFIDEIISIWEYPFNMEAEDNLNAEGGFDTDDIKVGQFVQSEIIPALKSGRIPPEEIKALQQYTYSNVNFHTNYPVLIKASGNIEFDKQRTHHSGRSRYYQTPFLIGNDVYFMSSQWYKKHKTIWAKWLIRFA